MNENLTFIIAIIGALAWLQQPIIGWLKKKYSKPKLTTFIHEDLEIGYTTFGPILNLNIAFSIENKDSLINYIDLRLVHASSNATFQLKWVWFEEKFMEIEVPEQLNIPYKRNQIAIVLKLNTENVIEKKIGFQSSDFKIKTSDLQKACNQEQLLLSNSQKSPSEIESKKCYNDYNDLFKSDFTWKEGKYNISIKTKLVDLKEEQEVNFSFNLNSLDIKKLEQNIITCQGLLRNQYINLDPNYQPKWYWVNSSKE